jgi:hypothetical protein
MIVKWAIVEMLKMEESTGIIVMVVGVLLLMLLSFLSPLMTDADRLIALLLPLVDIIAGGCLLFVKNKKPSDDEQDTSRIASKQYGHSDNYYMYKH